MKPTKTRKIKGLHKMGVALQPAFHHAHDGLGKSSDRSQTADRQLFRQEAIDFQRHTRQWGSVAALQPFSTKVFSWFLVTIVALIAAFLVRGEYARKETVVGYLTPTSGTAKVFV